IVRRLCRCCSRHLMFSFVFCFFFQAEDGIRDWSVTGVQTCALPISVTVTRLRSPRARPGRAQISPQAYRVMKSWKSAVNPVVPEIGRASCRERVEMWGVAGALKKKKEAREGTKETKRE